MTRPHSIVPPGLEYISNLNPALKRRAIIGPSPLGTGMRWDASCEFFSESEDMISSHENMDCRRTTTPEMSVFMDEVGGADSFATGHAGFGGMKISGFG